MLINVIKRPSQDCAYCLMPGSRTWLTSLQTAEQTVKAGS